MNDHNRGLYEALKDINHRPSPFEAYTAKFLWDDEHISKQMLAFHLNEEVEPASRPQEFIDRSASWIIDRFSLVKGKRVADFGCGPGLYATDFAKAGAAVTGIDFSRRSIAYARSAGKEKGLDIDYVLADYLEYQTDRKFDLVSLIYCDLCPLSPKQRGVLLGTFRNILADDGAVLLDAFSLHAFGGRQEGASYEYRLMGGFWSANDYWGFLNTFKYEDAKVVLDKYTVVEPSRTQLVYNWLQYYSLESLAKELEKNGLRIVEQYADVAGSEYADDGDIIAVIAVKI